MLRTSRIYIAGHRGLVGSAILRRLQSAGCERLIFRDKSTLDLTDRNATEEFFEAEKPEYVFVAAAKVGGILANSTYPAEFIIQNLQIETNVINAAFQHKVKRLVFLGSSCIYPRDCPQPIREKYLLSGPLELTNRAYAIAKIAGVELCRSYNLQYGTQFLAVMPTNLYGPGDNYDPENSHVLPALIRRFHEAKVRGDAEVSVWGSGAPRREFLYSDDLADACVFLVGLSDQEYSDLLNGPAGVPLVNIGVGTDETIRALADKVCRVVGFQGSIVFDKTKPDGTPRKLLDVSRINNLGWRASTSLESGLGLAYQDYLNRFEGKADG